MLINELFPTVIGFSENKKHNNLLTRHLYKIQKQINSGGQNWGSTVYNTDGTYNLHKDLKFNKLNDWIFSEVNNYKDIDLSNKHYTIYEAPTQSLLQKWLREEHNIHITITSISQESWQYHITKPGQRLGDNYEEDFYTYEEALESGLHQALKLI